MNIDLQTMSNVGLITMYLGHDSAVASEEELALNYDMRAELIRRKFVTLTPNGHHWHYEQLKKAEWDEIVEFQRWNLLGDWVSLRGAFEPIVKAGAQ